MAMKWCTKLNSLVPGKFEWNFRSLIFQIISVIDSWGISCELVLRWMSLDLTDDKSTLVQVMAWCCQATSHYLSQCWPISLSPYGVTRPQWVNMSIQAKNRWFESNLGKITRLVAAIKSLRFALFQVKSTGPPGCPWWRHQMETFSALLALCAGNSPVTGEFPAQRPVMRSFDVFFDLRLSKRLSKQSWGWWFEMPSHPLWCHCNYYTYPRGVLNLKD